MFLPDSPCSCGAEFTFGAHDGDSSAVVAIHPKTAPGCTFRESIPLGPTHLSQAEIRALANRMGEELFFGTACAPPPKRQYPSTTPCMIFAAFTAGYPFVIFFHRPSSPIANASSAR
jgi:hypothetical protein